MKRIKAALRAVYTSTAVRSHAFDLIKIIVGVLLAHYGIKHT